MGIGNATLENVSMVICPQAPKHSTASGMKWYFICCPFARWQLHLIWLCVPLKQRGHTLLAAGLPPDAHITWPQVLLFRIEQGFGCAVQSSSCTAFRAWHVPLIECLVYGHKASLRSCRLLTGQC